MKYIWLILLGLMAVSFAGATLFSNKLFIPAKPDAAAEAAARAAALEKREDTQRTSQSNVQQNTAVANRNARQSKGLDNRPFYSYSPSQRVMAGRQMTKEPIVSEAPGRSESTPSPKPAPPVIVVDPYDPNCNSAHDICAPPVKTSERPRRVKPAREAVPNTDPSSPAEKKENSLVNAIKKIIPS
jgi:hypothetical protein